MIVVQEITREVAAHARAAEATAGAESVRLQLQAVQRTASELKEADRRKNEFLGVLAHELRNPLAPIHNAVQVMRLQGGVAVAQAAVGHGCHRSPDTGADPSAGRAFGFRAHHPRRGDAAA